MPLLYGTILFGIILWLIAGGISNGLKAEREAATGGTNFKNTEGKCMAGFLCDLTGEEYKKALKAILDNINEYESNLVKLLEKYGSKLVSIMVLQNEWRGRTGLTSSKKDKTNRDLYIKCEKDYENLVETFRSKSHPILRKYDKQETFGGMDWRPNHPWIKMVNNKYQIACATGRWNFFENCGVNN